MSIPNRIHADDLRRMSISEIAALPVEQQAMLQASIHQRLEDCKKLKSRLDAALDHRFGQRARNVRSSHGKDTGTIHFEDGPITITAKLPKRVKWDQSKLADIIETIRLEWREDPAQYVKTELKVSEAAYSAWPEVIRELFRPARTVATGKPSYLLEIAKHGEGAQ
jgi:hypothetical protein